MKRALKVRREMVIYDNEVENNINASKDDEATKTERIDLQSSYIHHRHSMWIVIRFLGKCILYSKFSIVYFTW